MHKDCNIEKIDYKRVIPVNVQLLDIAFSCSSITSFFIGALDWNPIVILCVYSFSQASKHGRVPIVQVTVY